MHGKIYRLELQSAGLFLCSKTKIKFQVTCPIIIEYEVESWRNYHNLLQNPDTQYEILGPLFNVKSPPEPGVISAVYLPHCLCSEGFADYAVSVTCVHFKDDNIILEKPSKVESYYVVLENPTFSPIGVILSFLTRIKDGITNHVPVHGMVLIYNGIIGDPDHQKHRIHLYLMPANLSVETVSCSNSVSYCRVVIK
ncbi:NACHT, LRR and PYD domains-containing protein 1a-like [Pyxicephalus adspersus]|uniref:NACHT, LRR and PYD domains-containing protein 1a-like n=1 Tax=Pyxicephalus adspersus TaxID=30357 RepID=UPI003B5A4711